MNVEWCLKQLNSYLHLLHQYDELREGRYGRRGAVPRLPQVQEVDRLLLEQYPVLIEVLGAVDRSLPSRAIYRRDRNGYIVDNGSGDAAKYAIGALTRQQEIRDNLSVSAPSLRADKLHSWVWDAARTLWDTKHFREAVQAASTSVNAHLQNLVARRDVFDSALVMECFSDKDPEPGKPRLRWPGEPTDAEYKAMQAGLRALGQGAFMTIRNRATHDLDDLSEHDALERLATMSLLCKWIQMREVVCSDSGK